MRKFINLNYYREISSLLKNLFQFYTINFCKHVHIINHFNFVFILLLHYIYTNKNTNNIICVKYIKNIFIWSK